MDQNFFAAIGLFLAAFGTFMIFYFCMNYIRKNIKNLPIRADKAKILSTKNAGSEQKKELSAMYDLVFQGIRDFCALGKTSVVVKQTVIFEDNIEKVVAYLQSMGFTVESKYSCLSWSCSIEW